MKPPSRAGRKNPTVRGLLGHLAKRCPQCDAAPGWPCVQYTAPDADGIRYIRRTLKTIHRARKIASS